MKKLIALLCLLASASLHAGTNLVAPTNMPHGANLPVTCNAGDFYQKTSATSGQQIYSCESANTWVLQGDGGGSGGMTPGASYYVQVGPATPPQSGAFNISSGTVNTQLNLPYLTQGNCLQLDASSGKVISAGAPCGSGGGGGTTIWSKQNGANVDTAVSTINVVSGGGLSITSSPSGQINLSLSASSTYYSPAKAAVTSISSDYLVTSTDTAILADGTSASITVTLPTAVGVAGKVYRVKRQNGGANTVTIATTSAQTIDGATTQVLTSQYTSVDLISDGTNWSLL